MHRKHPMTARPARPAVADQVQENGDLTPGSVDKKGKSGRDGGKTAWDTVLLSRKADRPVATDYINAIFDEFIEFHGDRYFKDDGAIVGGIAMFHGMPVTVIGQQTVSYTHLDVYKRQSLTSAPSCFQESSSSTGVWISW